MLRKKSDEEILNDLEDQLLEEEHKTVIANKIADTKERIEALKEERKKRKRKIVFLSKAFSGLKDYGKGISKNFER